MVSVTHVVLAVFQALKCDVLTAVEREEMHYREKATPIPEFYAGSILRISYKEAMSRNAPKRIVRSQHTHTHFFFLFWRR